MNIKLFEKNMRLATQAIKHVKNICFLGEANDRNNKNYIVRAGIVGKYRLAAQEHAIRTFNAGLGIPLQRYFIQLTAEQAKRHGIGNCMEQSCLAFEFLKKKTPVIDVYKIKSLRMQYSNLHDGDHMFVVIGLDIKRTSTLLPINEMCLWNRDAVICDPWNNDAYPAYMYTVKAISGGGWHLIEHSYGKS